MKLRITMKTPDCVYYAIKEAKERAKAAVENRRDREAFDEEMSGTFDDWEKLCEKWFKNGECLNLEIDTEAESIQVLEIK